MQRLEVSGAVRHIYKSLGVKGLNKMTVRIIHTNSLQESQLHILECSRINSSNDLNGVNLGE